MDINSIISGGLSGTVLAIFYVTYKILKRSKCRSKCCGYVSSMSVDITSNSSSNSLEKPMIVV